GDTPSKVVNGSIAAARAYDPAARSAVLDRVDSNARSLARTIAASLPPRADVYVLDRCRQLSQPLLARRVSCKNGSQAGGEPQAGSGRRKCLLGEAHLPPL